MVSREPDITRLLDRLERRGLIARTRDARDRRIVTANITRGGDVLADLDRPVADLHARQLSPLGKRSLEQLIDLLEKARDVGS